MDAGEKRQGMLTGTDRDFFVTVNPRNWKRLKEEEEKPIFLSKISHTDSTRQ
jgi:hypothetical protein